MITDYHNSAPEWRLAPDRHVLKRRTDLCIFLDKCNQIGYAPTMIKSFSNKGMEGFFYDGTKKGIQPKHADKIGDILDRLEAASGISDMKFPGSGLHLLEPKKEGRWAVKVSGNWRITFRFEGGDAYEVDYKDYH